MNIETVPKGTQHSTQTGHSDESVGHSEGAGTDIPRD